jgi:hypothetical protein
VEKLRKTGEVSVAEFADEHGLSRARVRKLIRDGRVYPVGRLDSGPYVLYPNSVIIRPFERPNRRLRGEIDS